jgi:hypothetical protein
MSLREFVVLQAIDLLQDRDRPVTTSVLGPLLADVVDTTTLEAFFEDRHTTSKGAGYILRSLERRGLVEVVGRRHGGARKWALTDVARAAVRA